jgi:hypothetical protein
MVCSSLVMTRSPKIPVSKETDINATMKHYLLCVSRNNTRIYIHILHLTYPLDLPNLLLPYHAQTQPVRQKFYQSILI